MTTERLQSNREKKIREYFDKNSEGPPYAFPVALFLMGVSLIVVGFVDSLPVRCW